MDEEGLGDGEIVRGDVPTDRAFTSAAQEHKTKHGRAQFMHTPTK